jgi:hypothetical protein
VTAQPVVVTLKPHAQIAALAPGFVKDEGLKALAAARRARPLHRFAVPLPRRLRDRGGLARP